MRMILDFCIWSTDMRVVVIVITTSLETPFWTEFCYFAFSLCGGIAPTTPLDANYLLSPRGSAAGIISLHVTQFRELHSALLRLPDSVTERPLVTIY